MTFVSAHVLPLLGVPPIIGRLFTADEDRLGGATNQVVLSHGLWQTRFGGATSVLGTVIHLRGAPYTVVGVMPPNFAFPEKTQVWVPLMARYASYKDDWWKARDSRMHNVIARVKEGVSLAQARADMAAVAGRLAEEFAGTNTGVQLRLTPLRDADVGTIRPYLLLLLSAVTMVLLICCVNVANLLLARATSREREITIRAALGSSRSRVVQMLLVESLLLSLAGGMIGLGVGWLGVQALHRLIPVDLPFWMTFHLSTAVLAFNVVMTALTSVLFGLVPALQMSKADLTVALKEGAKGAGGGERAGRVRNLLVIGEVALSLLLLVGAGLMMQSFLRLQQVEIGLTTRNLLTVQAGKFVPNATPDERERAYAGAYRRVIDKLAQLPGVVSASGGTDFPYLNKPEQREKTEIAVRGQNAQEARQNAPMQGADVTPGYFETLGIPILQGRDFTESDDLQAPRVALVSQRTAAALWPGRDAIGQMIRWGQANPANDNWHRVIGVVGNTKWSATEGSDGYEMYFSYRQWPGPGWHYFLRTKGDPLQLAAAIRQTVQESDSDMAVVRIRAMDDVVADALWQRRLWGVLFATFAGIAVALAAVGIYGVMSYLVSQRTREIGIRMALGAQGHDAIELIVGQGLKLVMAGVVIGLISAVGLFRLMAALLFGVTARDPGTFAAVALLLVVVAAVACYLPARRAARIDPIIALRQD